jgi:putative redox protein
MADTAHRTMSVTRSDGGVMTARNVRDGTLVVGDGSDERFSPTELLLAALASCTAIDVDTLTSRRAEPTSFEVRVDATKVRDELGNRLQDLVVTFRVAFPEGPAGDAAREVLPEAVRRSHNRLCTVGRTIETGPAVGTRIEDPAG